jgi:hypothetical protein
LALYATTNFGYYILADGSTLIVTIKEGVTQGCNFGTLLFNLGYALQVLSHCKRSLRESRSKRSASTTTRDT